MDQCLTVTGGMNLPELPKQKDEVYKTFHENMEDWYSKGNEKFQAKCKVHNKKIQGTN